MTMARNNWLRWNFLGAVIQLAFIVLSLQTAQGETAEPSQAPAADTTEQSLPRQFPMEKPRMILVEELAK
jgi:hypothetical protein